jgi:hypothetical protein
MGFLEKCTEILDCFSKNELFERSAVYIFVLSLLY